MSDDLIKRIREGYNNWDSGYKADGALLGEAADLIEQQAARIAELEARIAANGAEPEGWKLVPIEPTLEMCQAASKIQTYDATFNKPFMTSGSCIYRHMLNAAPVAPVARGPRYDWSVSGMKQSDTGNWVMAGSAEKTGE